MKRKTSIVKILNLLLIVTMVAFAATACDRSGCNPGSDADPTPTPAPTTTPAPTAAPTATPAPAPAGDCQVNYVIDKDWQTGFTGYVTISNNSNQPISGWSLQWTFSGDQQITTIWDGKYTQNGSAVTASNENHNQTIASHGGSAEFGFNASYSGANGIPNDFSLNGTPCSLGSDTSPGPTPTPTPPTTTRPTPVPDPGDPLPVLNGTAGYATRYWDCCKPHCGWNPNVPADVTPVGTCDVTNVPNGISDMIKSSCDGGAGYTCWNMAPYAVSDKLAYGYAAVPADGDDICGKCYQLDFTGTSFNGNNDAGSAALGGKTMIVQATNIGYDVQNHQFDLLIPGGGVGAFDACTKQWGATADQMGEQYGGFLLACKKELGWNAPHDSYKECVMNRCEDLFSASGREDLLDGCRWFVDWFEAADNPNLVFKEVECPDALNNVSGMLP